MTALLAVELGVAAMAGGLAGWFAHAVLRRRFPSETAAHEGSSSGNPQVSPLIERIAAAPGSGAPSPGAARPISRDATTAGRVIVHLSSLGRLGNDDVGLPGFTQRGMSEALDIRQGTLTKVLSRLRAARVVEVDRRHVRGQPRRLNVYRLTALGESVARDLRHRRPDLERSEMLTNVEDPEPSP